MLLTAAEREYVLQAFKELKEEKLKKGKFNKFSVVRGQNGELFSIYNGGKKTHFQKGSQGVLKVAQKIDSTELCLVKIQTISKGRQQEQTHRIQESKEELKYLEKDKRNLLYGYQERTHGKNFDYKSYTFLKILPGHILYNPTTPWEKKGTFCEKFPELSEKESIILLQNLLEALQELHKDQLIHRDLHAGNVLVHYDGNDKFEINFIDFGLSLDANTEGYCWAHQVSDTKKQSPQIRYANGFDILKLLDTFASSSIGDKLMSNNKTIENFITDLQSKVGNFEDGFKSVDLEPYIKEIQSLVNVENKKSDMQPM